MARHLPTSPGWYRNPDEPRSLRYWDGNAWTARLRSQPPWASGVEPLGIQYDEIDRSIEGPVHPYEIREPVASGTWGREWLLSWRPRPGGRDWHPGAGGPASRHWRPVGPKPSAKLGPARRPLLFMVCGLVVALAAVISSFAVMSPYQDKGALSANAQAVVSIFTAQAAQECGATLPRYRGILAQGADGPSIVAAAHQVDLLRERLASIPFARQMEGPVEEWLETWQDFTNYQRRYAAIIGPAVRRRSGLAPRNLAPRAQVAAHQARQEAAQSASLADRFGTGMHLDACRLEASPPV